MKTRVYKASDRGTADYGWLKANYSFSFANYYNPDAVNFGALRVLNDDVIAGGMGFGTHPHDNMEIISIPLKGALKHRDSMSEKWISLQTGEVQVMSAGTGIQHSEKNNSTTEAVNLFQIWIIPNQQDVTPNYSQKVFEAVDRKNKLQVLVSFIGSEHNDSLKINQHAQISRLDLDENKSFTYNLMSEKNGVYVMVIEGEVSVENEILKNRDAIGVEETKEVALKAIKTSEILFIEVPMKF